VIRTQRVPRWFTGVLALWSFGLVVPSTTLAQHGPGRHGSGAAEGQEVSAYDTRTEATFNGIVADIETVGRGRLGWLTRVHTLGLGHKGVQEKRLLLKTDTGIVHILLGPAEFLKSQKVEIGKGDTLEVVGSPVTVGQSKVVLAREIREGDKAWTLRNTDGEPLWGPTQAKPRGFWTAKKILFIVVAVKVALLTTVLSH
jgi:hypothetical protein